VSSQQSPDVAFSLLLRALYEAAGSPDLASLGRQAKKQRPPLTLSDATLSDWFSGKSIPFKEDEFRFLVNFLEARAAEKDPKCPRRSADVWWRLRGDARRARRAQGSAKTKGGAYAEYLRLLRSQDADEAVRQQAGSDRRALQSVRLSLDRLGAMDPGGDAARLLRVLSLLSSNGVSRDLLIRAEQRLGLAGGLRAAVGVLVKASLVTVGDDPAVIGNGDGHRIRVHRQTALVIRHEATLPPGDDLQAALDTTAALLDELTDAIPEEQVMGRLGELEELADHLDAALTHATHAGDPPLFLLVQADWLARLIQASGDLIRAIALPEQVLTYRQQILGDDHPDTLQSRNNLAYAYASAGRYGQAISLSEMNLTECLRVLGDDHPNTLISRNSLAYTYQLAGRLGEAITLHEQTLADRWRVLGDDHPDTLTSRNNLAGAYASAGRLDEAITLHEQTLADRRRVLGDHHPDTLTSRNNLACAYQSAGRRDQAIPLFEQTLADCRRVLGDDHPDTLASLDNLEAARRIKVV
jgi:tetratricopeptide (TPR) repeat protein